MYLDVHGYDFETLHTCLTDKSVLWLQNRAFIQMSEEKSNLQYNCLIDDQESL